MQKLEKPNEGFKRTEIGEIPEDWKVVKLSEISTDFISGGTPSTCNLRYWNGNIPWTRSAWLKERYVITGEKFITEQGLSDSSANLVPKDNILIATRVSIGNVAINKINIAINQDLTGIIIDKSKTNEEYLYWYLLKSKDLIKSFVQGSTIKGLTRDDLASLTETCLTSSCSPLSVCDNTNLLLSRTYGKEAEVERLIRDGLSIVQGEPATAAWFGILMGPSTFGIFDRLDSHGKVIKEFD